MTLFICITIAVLMFWKFITVLKKLGATQANVGIVDEGSVIKTDKDEIIDLKNRVLKLEKLLGVSQYDKPIKPKF